MSDAFTTETTNQLWSNEEVPESQACAEQKVQEKPVKTNKKLKGANCWDFWNTRAAVRDKCKNSLCYHYENPRHCEYGDECQFAHDEQEHVDFNGTKQRWCAVWWGMCLRGKKCTFAHDMGEMNCYYWRNKKTVCREGDQCEYAHRPAFHNTLMLRA